MGLLARFLQLLVLIFYDIITQINGEIHRAKSTQRAAFPKNSFQTQENAKNLQESNEHMFTGIWNSFSIDGASYNPWIWSIMASIAIGLSGVLPLVIIPIEAGSALKKGDAAKTLRLLLSFAVGSLLGDVFLHLLPEAWQRMETDSRTDIHWAHLKIGLWVLAGIFTFVIVEILFEKEEEDKKNNNSTVTNGSLGSSVSSTASSNGSIGISKSECAKNCAQIRQRLNGQAKNLCESSAECIKEKGSLHVEPKQTHDVAGYLNLLANSIDNFTHGLAVAGSFLVNFKVGILTTFAILIHEIPHEIGDFAILLKSGFNRYDAAKAQIATASVGLLGAIAALSAESAQSLGDRTAWILPFTAGGFLNIALVNVLPDILKETDKIESMKQMLCLMAGISVMAVVTLFFG